MRGKYCIHVRGREKDDSPRKKHYKEERERCIRRIDTKREAGHWTTESTCY